MKKNSWKILPRKEILDSNDQIPLILRARINGKYYKHSLGLSVPALKYWDPKNNLIRNNRVSNPFEANKSLSATVARVVQILNDATIFNRSLNKEQFVQLLINTELGSTESFYDFCLDEIGHMKKAGFAKETIRSYESYVSKLKRYKPALAFLDITMDFLRRLNEKMVSNGNKQNTRQKMFAFINTMLNRAKAKGIVKENILNHNMPVKKKEGQRSFLTLEELKLLEDHQPSSKNLRIVLDYFLFACYTGLRYTDLRNLRFTGIVKIDGQSHIRIIMHKTKDEVTIPLIPKARELIPQKGFINQRVFKVRCNQVSNRDLKTLVSAVGIEKKVTMHCARHTFATVALSLGIDIMVISKILGHKELGTTRIYAKLQDRRKIEEMKKWE